jgi:hypothetical protein
VSTLFLTLTIDDELRQLILDIIDEYNTREAEDKASLIECIQDSVLWEKGGL